MYYFLRPVARIALKSNFRKIYLTNVDRIPKDKPVILAANHPTAFTEPCILACTLPYSLNFLVRGDFFKNPIFRFLLESTHMIPIFRLQDGGYSKLRDNYATFEKCYDALKKNKVIMILAEGRTKHEKRLRPIQKGTARIAFGSYEKMGDLDIHIIPVGVNYTNSDQFRSDVMIDIGEAIKIKDYLDVYKADPFKAIKNMTDDIQSSMQERIITIKDDQDIELVESLFTLARNGAPAPVLPIVDPNPEPLRTEIKISEHINGMEPGDKEELKNQIQSYFKKLESNGITDKGLMQSYYSNPRTIFSLILGFVGFIIGHFGNFLPLRFSQWIGDTFPKTIEFRHSVKIAAGLGVYLVFYTALLISAIILKNTAWWIFVLALPFFGYFSLVYRETYHSWKQARAVKQLSDSTLANLHEERSGIGVSTLINQ